MNKLSMLVIHIFLLLMVGFSAQVGAYDEVSLKKLKALGSCPSCDLSEANLEDAYLGWAKLEGANLYKAYLTEANLTGANLRGADLEGADLETAKMKNAKMKGAILCNTTMPDGSILYSGC